MKANMIPFYNNWTFLRTDLNVTMGEIENQKTRFVPVELPHDWLIYDAKNLYQDGCGWYRKEFELSTGEIEDLGGELGAGNIAETGDHRERIIARIHRGERVILRFDGVYMDATVYVNGAKIGDWKYGYSTFDMDVTSALIPGRNLLTVQVRFQSPNSRWYSGAGIYRKVWLKVCPAVYLPLDGTYVTTEKTEGGFELKAVTEVAGKLDLNVVCRYRLRKGNEPVQELGRVPVQAVCEETAAGNTGAMREPEAGETFCERVRGMAELKVLIQNPVLWDVEDPQCYRLTVELCLQGHEDVIDSQDITVGFRTIEFTTDRGLFLNGRHVKIHGVCEHHDLGCLGAAFHVPAMERKLRMLQKMGVNAIRTSHNMPAPELMELADRMGMLILSESFDMWELPKTEYDYGRFFKTWCEKDVRSWVRRDRNHPSLLLWSIGNEIYDTHADGHGQEITRRLVKAVREHDPDGNALITIGSNYMPWENARKCADIVKVAGYNYAEKYYEEHHREHPDWIMYGSETASVVQSRGIYHFPLSQEILSDEDEQCSSLGNSNTSWGARSWEKCIADDRDPEYIWGQFIWTGFDYIGEPTPYHTKNSYFGQIDTAGFPKDSYYVFQAEWTDVEKAPMVHLFPYWDFNRGQLIDVRACTNASEVELFVNEVSQGRRTIDHVHGQKLVADWQVPYEPGTITAVAYDGSGREVARDSHTSFGDSKKIVLSADRQELAADCEDMCFITVSVTDEKGNPVENAADYVKAELKGPGRILGLDNGDSTDYDNYKSTVRKLFSGKLLVVVGSTAEEGELELQVSGRNLEPAALRLTAEKAAEDTVQKPFLEDCGKGGGRELPDRVPIRKLELCSAGSHVLSPQSQETTVEALLYPEDTTDRTLVWKAVNAGGIQVNFAEIRGYTDEQGRNLAKVRALGDGAFYVRCMVQDGTRTVLISQLEYRAEGLGQATLNPYEFVSAGLYSKAIGDIGSGNEKGIATARDGASGVVFTGVDFGEYGSDEITLPVFALSGEQYLIDIWVGTPYEEGSRLIDTVAYRKPSIWNVYQEQTYILPERIRGVQDIGFILHDKVHIKGFVFGKQAKAYGKLYGGEANAVYGDTFTRDGNIVRGIGNNVSIVYENMDFGPEGAGSVSICGRTPLAVNTIHIHFTDEAGETVNRIVEFAGDGGEMQTFSIERLRGKGKVELIFLPGSNFDLESVQFTCRQI
ncbi:MAG: DUF4982 domain-containing protein [Butyrivibrio sp.]|nr:DUF4982 domain-containing protein [Acetatifactor muris]MCM1559011.1 DUF4982 domain-containing protein [Butyrivibrio sp.]